MIWDRELMSVVSASRYRRVSSYADEFAYRDRDQLLIHLRRQCMYDFIYSESKRHGVTVSTVDIEVWDDHEPILTHDGQSTNVTRYVMNARWRPTSNEVLFVDGPIGGRVWQLEPQRIGQAIVALEAPIEPWFAHDDNREYETLIAHKVIYELAGWDDEARQFIYRPRG